MQSTPPRASPIEKQARIFQEVLGILRIGSVARIRVHDELSIWEMLSKKERIDRRDDDVLAPMHNQRRMVDLAQHRKAVRLGDHAPLADSGGLGEGRLLRHQGVAVLDTKLRPLNKGSPRGLTRLAL